MVEPQRIEISDLKRKLETDREFLLIDLREQREIDQDGAIPGAIHIPMGELDARMDDLPKNAELIFY